MRGEPKHRSSIITVKALVFGAEGSMRKNAFRILCTLLVAVVTAGFPFTHAHAAWVVTNTNDSGSGSLREAITNASDGNLISFSVSGTITLASTLVIDKSLTIDGTNQSIKISGNNSIRVLDIITGTVTLKNLTIQNGKAQNGGGITNLGNLKIEKSTFVGNTATASGGGAISNSGSLIVFFSTFYNNRGRFQMARLKHSVVLFQATAH